MDPASIKKTVFTAKFCLCELFESHLVCHHLQLLSYVFDPESLVAFCKQAADQDSTYVIIAAINNGTTQKPIFPGIKKLVPLANCAYHLRASCTLCGRDAPFTISTTPVKNNNWVGGAET